MFSRLDWSPDGAYLLLPAAMNNGGPTVQIVARNRDWSCDLDLVGHSRAVTAVVCVNRVGTCMTTVIAARVSKCVGISRSQGENDSRRVFRGRQSRQISQHLASPPRLPPRGGREESVQTLGARFLLVCRDEGEYAYSRITVYEYNQVWHAFNRVFDGRQHRFDSIHGTRTRTDVESR